MWHAVVVRARSRATTQNGPFGALSTLVVISAQSRQVARRGDLNELEASMRAIPLAAAALLTAAAALVPNASAAPYHAAPANGRIVYSVGEILPDPDLSGASQVWS